VRYSHQRVRQGRDLANKLWNASRLILMGVDPEAEPSAAAAETVEDRWIVSRLDRATRHVGELIDGFRLAPAALELYDVFWSELCDWYLELAKPRLYGDDNGAVSAVLLHALERSLTLLHPVMPFVTEEIWSHLPGERGLLAVAHWPEPDEALLDDAAEETVGRLIEAVTSLRRYRDDVGAKASVAIPARLAADYDPAAAEQIARLARFEFLAPESPDGEVFGTLSVPGGDVHVLRSDAFDPAAAEERLANRRTELGKEIERLEGKLANSRFVERAPADVVEGERRKLEEYQEELRRLPE
jgi:valyl-tRNA synthetase